MHHIEIYVSNLIKTKEFYSWLLVRLGFELFQNWEQGFSYKKDGFYLVFVQTKDKYIDNGYNRCNIGLNHLAFSCSSKKEIDTIREHLLQNGTKILYDEKYPYAGGSEHYAVYFEDPDRIKIEIVFNEL
ncbi:VOC family protein [Gemelliphila palaticanis]|uniref:VOC family protein n=1 Tax=Gemelliphila palaticanis TaxID=81950 RepID=A0ABX2SZP9_9BACL|nr:VOC family protein [Gemella palaticanis]MBF0714674.1 VOC family protein [Gemella palaticanis]NYS46604.1 VOC family protein [Gemella palaticanis]